MSIKDEYYSWDELHMDLTESGRSARAPRMHDEGILEFHEDEIEFDTRLFDNAEGGRECGKHRLWSTESDGLKAAYLVDAVAFSELLGLAIECKKRRNIDEWNQSA